MMARLDATYSAIQASGKVAVKSKCGSRSGKSSVVKAVGETLMLPADDGLILAASFVVGAIDGFGRMTMIRAMAKPRTTIATVMAGVRSMPIVYEKSGKKKIPR